MIRVCAACGRDFEAKRATAKYCGSSCRARVSTGAALPIKAPLEAARPSGLVESTRAALVAAGRDSEPLAMAAIELAAAIVSPETPSAAKATLTREFRVTLAESLRGAAKASGPQQLRDELAARRAAQA